MAPSSSKIRCSIIIAASLASIATLRGNPPEWWSEGDPPVIASNAQQNNNGPSNIGQGKWMAKCALNALKDLNPSLAATVEIDLVGPNRPIPSWDPPANEEERTNQHTPLLIGQLKAIATPFYNALHTAEPEWLETQLTGNLTKDSQDASNFYPWTASTSDDQNKALATIGQLKAVFSLRFEGLRDSDDDGISDWKEELMGTDPHNGDSDDDDLSDADEIEIGIDPNDSDSDGDNMNDGIDADPKELLVDWEQTTQSSYVLVDVDVPVADLPRDLNDKGEVLFDSGIWSGGDWIPVEHELIAGEFPREPTDQGITTFDSSLFTWHYFNEEKKLAGSSNVFGQFIPDPNSDLDGGEWFYQSFVSWRQPEPQYCEEMAVHLPSSIRSGANSFMPMGIDGGGKSVGIVSYLEDLDPDPDTAAFKERAKIVIFPANGDPPVFRVPQDDQLLKHSFYPSTKVSSSGWIVCQTQKEMTTGSEPQTLHRVSLWNPDHSAVPLPDGAMETYQFRLNLTDLPNGRLGLTGVTGENHQGTVIFQNTSQEMKKVETLSNSGIQFFAGDGTAITHNHQLWRNGKLIPMQELCERYGELIDDGWSLHQLKANKNGVYLIQAEGPNGERRTKVQMPVDLDLIKPGTEENNPSEEIAEEKEDSEGEIVGVNWDDDNNSEGNGTHAKVVFKHDHEDPNGTVGEDDMIQLKLHKPGIDGVKARLKFDNALVRVWQKRNREDEVNSDDTEISLTGDKFVYLEGLKITEAENPTKIEMKIKAPGSGEFTEGDKVSVHVATPVITLAGKKDTDKHFRSQNLAEKLHSEEYLGSLRRDDRNNTVILKGKDREGRVLWYSVDMFDIYSMPKPVGSRKNPPIIQSRTPKRDKEMKMALTVQGAHVFYTGHSNYGIGPNFEHNPTSFDDYMNISSRGIACVDYEDLIGQHGDSNVILRNSDLAGTVINYIVPATDLPRFVGKYSPGGAMVLAGDEFTLKSESPPSHGFHYKVMSKKEGVINYQMIVRSTGDLPMLRYASCFMASEVS